MTDLEVRLVRCLQTVFPALSQEQARAASQDTVEGWDSVAMLTLLTVIEEEFEIAADYDRAEELTSYSGLLGYLGETQGRAIYVRPCGLRLWNCGEDSALHHGLIGRVAVVYAVVGNPPHGRRYIKRAAAYAGLRNGEKSEPGGIAEFGHGIGD